MKERVDLVIKAGYVITMGSRGVIRRGAIAVRNGVIVEVGTAESIDSRYRGEEVVDRGRDSIAMPGLVDCHTHTQQLLLRSAISDELLALPPIWTKLLVPFESRLSRRLAYISSLASAAAMARSGTTFFIEAGGPYPDAVAQVAEEVGIKAAVTPSFYNVLEGRVVEEESRVRERLLAVRGLRGRYARPWCSVRQVMMVTPRLLEEVAEVCRDGAYSGLTMHLAEYQGEVDYTLTAAGLRPLEYVERLGLLDLGKPVVLAHGVYVSPHEARVLARRRNVSVCWCPTVDSWLMGLHWLGLRYVDTLFGVGSDGGAFSELDLLHEVKVARAVAKALSVSISYTKTVLTPAEILAAATGAGGRVVGEKVGVLEPGYAADVVVLDGRRLHGALVYSPIEAVVNFMDGRDVIDVFVDGAPTVLGGSLVRVDGDRVVEKLLDAKSEVEPVITELLREVKKGFSTPGSS